MKKIILISISLTVLIIGSSISGIGINNPDNGTSDPVSVIVNQTGSISRPIFVNITGGNSNLIRERNETLGNGAIIKADLNKNVTITYLVVNGENTTLLHLYADVPGNHSLNNITETLAFTYDSVEYRNYTLDGNDIFNASLSYYTVEFNVSTSIIPFYVTHGTNDAYSENSGNNPMNFITTNQYWNVKSSDSFYIQDEDVIINLVANNSELVDVYGIKYSVDNGEYTYLNFTGVSGGDITDLINVGSFEPGTILTFSSVAYLNDSKQNDTRLFEGLDFYSVEVGDGTPTLIVDILITDKTSKLINNTYYSQNGTVVFDFYAEVSKGNISQFIFMTDVNTTVNPTVNASTSAESMNKTIVFSEGKTNITLFVKTNKGLFTNKTYQIVIDNVDPTGSVSLPAGGSNEITTMTGQVKFTFNFDDKNAGVYMAVLDLGNGVSVEVTSLSEFSYTYVGYNGTVSYTIILTVIDFAGNIAKSSFILTLTYDDGIDETATNSSGWIALLIGIGVMVLIYFSQFFYDFYQEKIKR